MWLAVETFLSLIRPSRWWSVTYKLWCQKHHISHPPHFCISATPFSFSITALIFVILGHYMKSTCSCIWWKTGYHQLPLNTIQMEKKMCYNAIHASCFEFMKTKTKIANMLQSVPLALFALLWFVTETAHREMFVFHKCSRVCAYLYGLHLHLLDCSK